MTTGTKKRGLATDEGESLAAIDVNTDVGQILYLLEYGRIRGFKIGPTVQINGVAIQVRDLRQSEGRQTADHDDEADIWEQHGYSDDKKAR